MIKMKALNVKILMEFMHIFQSSKNLSTEHWRLHFLLKAVGKRKWEEVKWDDAE